MIRIIRGQHCTNNWVDFVEFYGLFLEHVVGYFLEYVVQGESGGEESGKTR